VLARDACSARVLSLLPVAAQQNPVAAVVFTVALGALYHFKHRFTPVAVILGAAIAGQVMFK
jgi:hypothetical protein